MAFNAPYSTGPEITVQKKEGRGCFFYGCLIFVTLIVVGGGALAAGGYYLWGKFNAIITEQVVPLTETEARPIPTVAGTPDQYRDIKGRVDRFYADLDGGKPASLSLSADEINILIANDPEMKGLKGHVLVEMAGDEVGAQVSAPLSALPLPQLQNRFLNGSVKFTVGTGANNRPGVYLKHVEARGRTLPGDVLNKLQSQNLYEKGIEKDDSGKLQRITGLRVEDGRLLIEGQGQKAEKQR
jgi:hypothetical protein